MRTLSAAVLVACMIGCASSKPAAAPPSSEGASTENVSLPMNRTGVRVDGVDGTVMTGDMLNGSITIDSGQGPLTLQASHIHTITFGSDGDRIEADNINVAGKIREPIFNLKTKHGVFPLLKERIRTITFINNLPDEGDVMVRTAPIPSVKQSPPPPTTMRPSAPTTSSTRAVPPPTATRYRRAE